MLGFYGSVISIPQRENTAFFFRGRWTFFFIQDLKSAYLFNGLIIFKVKTILKKFEWPISINF